MATKNVYKVIFLNQGKIYEVYAKQVAQSAMFGFIEIEQLIFGGRTEVVIDPSEERLKDEFKEVKRTYIPMHAVIRIDEVEKEGIAKIADITGDAGQIIGFPGTIYSRQDTPKSDK
ncbi:MAG: DUF1820 family protein [Gammaproteobacteria bacterium]|jgi:hypothetical protein